MWERKPVSVRDRAGQERWTIDWRSIRLGREKRRKKKEKEKKKEAKETRRKPVLGQSAALLTQRRVSCLPRLSPKIPPFVVSTHHGGKTFKHGASTSSGYRSLKIHVPGIFSENSTSRNFNLAVGVNYFSWEVRWRRSTKVRNSEYFRNFPYVGTT